MAKLIKKHAEDDEVMKGITQAVLVDAPDTEFDRSTRKTDDDNEVTEAVHARVSGSSIRFTVRPSKSSGVAVDIWDDSKD